MQPEEKAEQTQRAKTAGTDVTLKIPRPLYNRLSQVIEGSGFRSVTEFCVYVLRDLVAAHEPVIAEGELSGSEVEAVRNRLRALGYLEE